MTAEENVDLLNELIAQGSWRLFVAAGNEDAYRPLDRVSLADLEMNRYLEIGSLENFQQIRGRPVRAIYREDRVSFVTASVPGRLGTPEVLLETNLRADPSPSATAVGKFVRKWLRKSAHQGVVVCSFGSDQSRLDKNVWWTDKALHSKKIWKQAESSSVYFRPALG